MMFSHLKKRKTRSDISVIIPFYNVEKYIKDCLDSVIGQNGVSMEIILVDDGSTDASSEIARAYAEANDNIRIFRTNNEGPSCARNFGVKQATGEYIAFMDADDILIKGIYRRMLKAARYHKAEMCICNVVRFNSEEMWRSNLHDKVYRNYKICTHITEHPNLIYDTTVWNKLIDREFYKRSKVQFPEHVVYEDISVNADLHLKCNKVVMLAETGYLWRSRDENEEASLSQRFNSEKNIRDRLLAVNEIIQRFNKKGVPKELRETAQFKLLDIDLKYILRSAVQMGDDKASEIFGEVKSIIENSIDESTIEQLSIADIQRCEFVKKEDIDGYKEFLHYYNEEYKMAPVKEEGGILRANIPDTIIAVSKRELNDEFNRARRKIRVDEIRKTENNIEVDAHIYLPRYNISNSGDMNVEVQMINEENNIVFSIPTQPIKTPRITKAHGKVTDPITGETASYNYDWAGFTFSISENIINQINLEKEKRIKFSFAANYSDRLFSGVQLISGVKKKTRKTVKKERWVYGDKTCYIKFGEQEEFFVIVKGNESNN